MSCTEYYQAESSLAGSSSHVSNPAEKDQPTKAAVQEALDANKKLQLILAERAEQLEAELKEADKLLQAASTDEGDEDPETEVLIPGAKKATSLLTSSELLNESYPFYNEAKKRSIYLANTTLHPMKPKDLWVLGDAVRQENVRLQACARLNHESNVDIDLENNLQGLDWTRISEKVSDASSVKRTPTECRITWIGDRHPRNNHAEWSTAEVKKLEAIVSEYVKVKQPVDWVKVAEKLGTSRTPIDCLRHGLPPHRHTWSPESDKQLIKAVATCGIDNWQLVAKNVSEYATASQCQARWQKTLDPGIRRGTWTEEEDERLRKAVVGYGKSWVQVSAAMSGRTNDQCRERWTEHINPSADKTIWSKEEDERLRKLVEELGKQWKVIGLKLGGNKTGQNASMQKVQKISSSNVSHVCQCRFRYDKLQRTSGNNNFKNTPQATPSLSAVSLPPTPSVAGPSQLVYTHPPETMSTVFTFAPNLGQCSFTQPSNSFNGALPAVNDPLPETQPVDENSIAKDPGSSGMSTSGMTEPSLDVSDQPGVVKDLPTVPRKSRKKAAEPLQRDEGLVLTTKPRPKPRLKVSKKAGQPTQLPSEAIDESDIPIGSPLTDLTSSPSPSASSSAKASGSIKGTKRKPSDCTDLEKTEPSRKKTKTSKLAASTIPDQSTEIASEPLGPSSSLDSLATTIAMRTETSNESNHNAGSATENLQPQLRRGRSRKTVTEADNNTSVAPETHTSVTSGNPPPKRPRGRPRKVQASS